MSYSFSFAMTHVTDRLKNKTKIGARSTNKLSDNMFMFHSLSYLCIADVIILAS